MRPKGSFEVADTAFASAIRAIAQADDSTGATGDACLELMELNSLATSKARSDTVWLADWIIDFHFDDEGDNFELDQAAYATALGAAGLAKLGDRGAELCSTPLV